MTDPRSTLRPYTGTVNRTYDWLETNPADVEKPPARVARDWALFALILGSAVAEVAFIDEMAWRWLGVLVGLILAFATLWRRTRPLQSVALGFGPFIAVDLATTVAGAERFSLNAGLAVLVLVYALFRWGTGRQAAVGSLIALVGGSVAVITGPTSATDAIAGLLVLLFPAALGASVRYRRIVRDQQFERVRLHERDALARELHDTVAHHVSAIAIQAQAGQVLANAGDVAGARQSLSLIEKQATLSLTEMRSVVATLRRAGEASEASVAHEIGDIQDLATPEGAPGPRVQVEMRGQLDDLRPGVQAALFRVAQEAVTNVNLHAVHAGRVAVSVVGGHDTVHLEVTDDGDRVAVVGRPGGYGLVGMQERVTLLGGTFQAGPRQQRGWTVQASIPRTGSPA
ncbi:MAG: histidine kinase [Ilumatobacteraceae bacterium]